MKLVIQRVSEASVTVADKDHHKQIGRGLMILIGVEKNDTEAEAEWLAAKVSDLRIFADDHDKMNLSLLDIGGGALVVSQFTLAGRCEKGRRPSFDRAAHPDEAIPLYEYFCEQLRARGVTPVETGLFGEMMRVALVNDGPVTLILERKPQA